MPVNINEVGTGDVNGPGSSTDNALVRWDGATGRYIQDSNGLLNDTGEATFQTTTDSQSAFTIKNANGNNIFVLETLNFDQAVTTPNVLKIEPNGFNGIPGSTSFIRGMRYRAELNSGTQSNAFRGFDTLLRAGGTLNATGDNSFRASNAGIAWNSTGTCESMIGMQNFLACGGGGGVDTGTITEAIANKALIGFNTNNSGAFTDGYCFWAGPNRVDATHTITNFYGLYIDDCDITGVTNAFAIKTGTGLVDFGDDVDVDGDVDVTGHVTGKKVGVYAYLNTPASTTITVAATYYPINGTFTNAPIEGFSAATVVTPGIKYDEALTQYFEIDWHASVYCDHNTTTVHFGIKKNGTLLPGSVMGSMCKNASQVYAISGTTVVELATDDEIQLVVTSDGSGDVITMEHYTTTITEFFD